MSEHDIRDEAVEFLFRHCPALMDDDEFVEAFCHYTLRLWVGFKEDAAEACCAILEEQREAWNERLRPGDN